MSLSDRILKEINKQKIQQLLQDQRLKISIYRPIGDISRLTKESIISDIKKFIDKDPSNRVVGTYTKRNLENRPKNTIIRISQNNTLIVLNVNDRWQQVIIMGIDLSEDCKDLLSNLLQNSGEVFIFGAGKEMCDFLEKSIPYDRFVKNTVFELKNTFSNDLESNYNLKWYIPTEVEEGKKEAMELWGYSEKRMVFLEGPHVVAVTDDKVVGGARTNAKDKDVAIIGGVTTLKMHRRRGIGYLVSAALTKELQNRGCRVFLETDMGNFPARKIYEKIGFSPIGISCFIDIGTDHITEVLGDRDY